MVRSREAVSSHLVRARFRPAKRFVLPARDVTETVDDIILSPGAR